MPARPAVPARMTYEQCASRAAAAARRLAKARRDEVGPRRREAYKAAEINRLLNDWVFTGVSPDEELRGDMVRVRWRARELERNTATARQYLRMGAVNIIGPDGLQCQPQVRLANGELDRATNERLRDAWADWAQAVTLDGQMDLNSFQRLGLKGVMRDGEAFVRYWRSQPDNPYGLALEYVDPDLVDSTYSVPQAGGRNEVRLGVEVNRYGRPVAYHVWTRPATLTSMPRERVRIPADQVRHLYDPERANQTRGISWLAPVMVPLKMMEGYREAEVVAARLSAAKMGFFERKEGEVGASLTDDERSGLDIEATPGSFLVLPDGYTASAWAADHPNTGYGAFVKDVMRHIAVGLGVSYNSLNSDLEGVNYSSMRSGLLIERDLWRTLQRWWATRFLTPLYREWVVAATTRAAATAGQQGLVVPGRTAADLMAVRWAPRGWPWVDPLKDTQAAIQAIQTGLGSRKKALAEQGLEYEDVLEDLQNEAQAASEYGVSVSGPGGGRPAGEAGGEPAGEAEGEADEEEGRAVLASFNGHAGEPVAVRPARRF